MEDLEISKVLKNIPQLPQVQYSLNDQLLQLIDVAAKLGLYDASNFIKNYLKLDKWLEEFNENE